SPFWKAWNVLNEKYVSSSSTEKVTDEDRVWGAIKGLTASLGDPYTVFFPPVESELFESDIRGNFEGVGMEVAAKDGVIVVVAPLKGSPAETAGIRAGDRIIKIDGKETSSLSTEEAVKLIRGVRGTKVTFTIFRVGKKEPLEISVTRDVINIPTINTKELGNGIFDIELYSFTAPSPNLFRAALREFIMSGNKKLILDLRGNPGGYLEAAIDMASWFLAPGKIVVKEDFGGAKDETIYRSKGYDIFNDGLPFVILVDGGSASAAEILAGALSEQGKATLVGDKTFGKGSVQELVTITPDTSLKVTIARWLTPNGNSISETGITPEYVVKRTQADLDAGRDPQLDKAIEILNR
ncbi:S41 family peptidase, partial [Candidatus Parcubacteria bacterium]|nr:S41 family peptidase [Candidatus Parcubacteria bacterium]